jgi:hypothetical protein
MGPWRSPVAHLHGMQGVRGSNPLGSTKVLFQDIEKLRTPKVRSFFVEWLVVLVLVKDGGAENFPEFRVDTVDSPPWETPE